MCKLRARRSIKFARAALGLGVCLLALVAPAQIQDFSTWQYRTNGAPGFYPPGTLGYGAQTNYYLNGSAGTVCNKLVKLDATGKAIVTAGGETSGVVGVAVADTVHGATCGTTGVVAVAVAGQVSVLFDAPTPTLSDYVGISAAAGTVTDSGSSPGTGQNIGRVIRNAAGLAPSNCNSGTGCYIQLQLGSSGGGGGGGGGAVLLAPVGSQTITQPGGTTLTVSGGNFIVIAPGVINGFFGGDSGSNAATNGNSGDNWQFSSGSVPGTQTLSPSGFWIPVWAAKVSGVTYASAFEMQANKDQINGYPSLNGTGQVPLAEVIAPGGLAGCNNTNIPVGDFSQCISAGGNPAFNSITTGSNNTAHMTVANGAVLDTDGAGGVIKATQLNNIIFPATVSGPNQIFVSSIANAVQTATLPNCKAINTFIQFDSATRTFPCGSSGPQIPSTAYVCNGASNACPNTAAVSGDTNNLILAQFTIPASQLTIGHCFNARMYFISTTGGGSISYKWNIGGTGSVGSDVVGGTNTSQASSVAGNGKAEIEVCAYSATAVYMRANQVQIVANQSGNSFQDAVPMTLSATNTLSFIGNMPVADTLTLTGGTLFWP